MAELSSLVSVYKRPMNVEKVYILELHELQHLFYLSLSTFKLTIEYLRSNEQLFSFDSSFPDHSLYGVS